MPNHFPENDINLLSKQCMGVCNTIIRIEYFYWTHQIHAQTFISDTTVLGADLKWQFVTYLHCVIYIYLPQTLLFIEFISTNYRFAYLVKFICNLPSIHPGGFPGYLWKIWFSQCASAPLRTDRVTYYLLVSAFIL